MRVDVKKWLFVGTESSRESFFKKAQDLGLVEFIDSQNTSQKEVPEAIVHLQNGIRVLQSMEVVEQEEVDDVKKGVGIAEKILALKHKEESFREERRVIHQEIARVGIYGAFSPSDIEYIEDKGQAQFQFFCAKKGVIEDLHEREGLFYIDTANGLDYFVRVLPKDKVESAPSEAMIELKIDEPLDVLQSHLQIVEEQIQETESELKPFAKYKDLLHQAFIDQLNQYHLERSSSYIENHLGDKLFTVQGWVSKDREEDLQVLSEESNVSAEPIRVEQEDREPTHLVNKGLARIGQDLVNIYDTPAADDADPSPWVLGSFALFFSMILNDGGYGLLFLLATAFLYFSYPKATGLTKRMIRLGAILSVCCIVWGVLTNSFFGMSMPIDHPTKAFSVLDRLAEQKAAYHLEQKDDVFSSWSEKFAALRKVKDGKEAILVASSLQEDGEIRYEMADKFKDHVLLELALLVGVLHLSLSFLRYIRRAPSGIGWILFMIGGYLYVPYYLGATSILQFWFGLDRTLAAETGQHLMIIGLVLAIGISIVQYKVMGILEIANLIQVFADVLSYLRLYALGLAGGIVAATVNDMSASSAVVFGFVILVLGHAVNILLSLMGGVIHGLRLNFIEWYHYSFEGGGKPFEPLKNYSTE